jgi:glutamyl/glutaminyl-tRNA synthetase
MDDEADAMFGKSAGRVIRHVEKVRDLAIAQQEALDNAAKNAETRRTEKANTEKLNSTKGKEMFQSEHKRLQEKYPKFFAKDETDPEGNQLLEKGIAMADRIFLRTPENTPKSAEEAVRLHALAYNKIANHDRLARKFKLARERIAELEKSLKEFEASEPGAGRAGEAGRSGRPADPMSEANAELDSLDKL